ncbi:MAG TPA: hypothetical protein VKX17_08345, partial [Planctomycetota bacterium]|nr:hypothetical protein [Planctomycetota bacterium]
ALSRTSRNQKGHLRELSASIIVSASSHRRDGRANFNNSILEIIKRSGGFFPSVPSSTISADWVNPVTAARRI